MIQGHFLREAVVHVDAAAVGLGRAQWYCVKDSEASEARAAALMEERRFDVLPIEATDGEVREYFRTGRWNDFTSVTRHRITYPDVLPSPTPIREVIRELATKRREFFFLTGDDGGLAGLLSIANLNCRQVRVFLFALLSELEGRLGAFLEERVDSRTLEKALKGNGKRHYLRDRQRGTDERPIEYLGFAELVELAAQTGLLAEVDLAIPDALEVRELRKLRNRIAHPIRSVARGPGSVAGLWRWIYLVEEMLFGLRLIQGHAADIA